MPTAPLYNAQGAPAGEAELNDAVFGRELRPDLVHLAVVRELADRRQGTHKVKTRDEVAGGGRKPYRQKGTGRARQGSIRAPHYRHGGIVHGPTPRSYEKAMPQKMRRAALLSALSGKAAAGAIRVMEGLQAERIKTKDAAALLATVGIQGRTVIVVTEWDQNLRLSLRNLPNVRVAVVSSGLSTYEIMGADTLIFTRAAVDRLQEIYAS
jgi:large subunit ribosomal protein L4